MNKSKVMTLAHSVKSHFPTFADALRFAWAKVKISTKLNKGLCYFTFTKKSTGEERDALGTTNFDFTITLDAAETAATKAVNDAATKAANDKATLEATYGWKRGQEYASVPDQLDQLYKDMVAGKLDTTGTWATGVKAIKDKHPK